MSEDIRIYVADLAAYNNGQLRGVWIDCTSDLDDIQVQINQMLHNSPVDCAEEYAIHDYEGFGSYELSEHESIEAVHEIALFIEEHPKVASALLDQFCGSIEEARKAADENYSGCYKSLADYAQELTEETSEIPSHLVFYIDYEKMGRDIELSGDIFTIETAHDEVHVFWGH